MNTSVNQAHARTVQTNQQGVQIAAMFPPVKQPQPQQTVVIVPEQKCMKNCCPILSKGCDLCSNCCGDYYINPICESVGITGLLNARPCLMYDEQWGGCGNCIGCQKDCDYAGFCPYPGYNRAALYATQHHGGQYPYVYQNGNGNY